MSPEEIRALRERLGLSQTEFGQLLGNVHQNTVSRWEIGQRRPNKFYRAILAVVAQHEHQGDYTPEFLARYTLGLDTVELVR